MFEAEKYPTHLGGEYANLDIIDLSPLELLRATASSRRKAALYTEVADAQAKAAAELGDTIGEYDYTEAARVLSSFADTHPLQTKR